MVRTLVMFALIFSFPALADDAVKTPSPATTTTPAKATSPAPTTTPAATTTTPAKKDAKSTDATSTDAASSPTPSTTTEPASVAPSDAAGDVAGEDSASTDVATTEDAAVSDAVAPSSAPAVDAAATTLTVTVTATVPVDVVVGGVDHGPTPLDADRALTLAPGAHLVALRERGTGRTHAVLLTTSAHTAPATLALDTETVSATTTGAASAVVVGSTPKSPDATDGAIIDDGNSLCPKGTPCLSAAGVAMWPRFRLRAGFEAQQPDPNVAFIGNNDGFIVDQARVGFSGRYKDVVDFTLTLDGAAFLPGSGANDPQKRLAASIIDAFVHYAPIEYFGVWIGQSFMPADQEGQTTRGVLNFTDRSVASGGVRAGRGFAVDGLSDGREIGLVLGAKDVSVGPVMLDYRVAVANGAGASRFGNDNKLPAVYSRFGIGWERYVTVGVGGHYNPRTLGDIAAQYNETEAQVFGDILVDAFGINFLTQVMGRQVTFDSVFPDVSDPARNAYGLGVTSWLVLDEPFGLPLFGIKPGYRISYYDPTTAFTDNTLLEHTVGLRFDPPNVSLPLAFIVDVTSLWELNDQGIQSFDNNRLTAMVQLNF